MHLATNPTEIPGLKTKIQDSVKQIGTTWIRCDGKKLSYFGGCDYFRLARHPRIIRAAHQALDREGLSVSASRVTTGNHPLFERLEVVLASFFGTADAVLFPGGYGVNAAVIQSLGGDYTHLILHEDAHPSLVDAAKFFEGRVIRITPDSVSDLARRTSRIGPNANLLLMVEGVVALDGRLAPLAEYGKLIATRGALLVDDAHGSGVLGAAGRGSTAPLPSAQFLRTGTLSKAFGAYGGFFLGTREACSRIRRCGMFTGSTPIPLPLAAAALESLTILRSGRARFQRLAKAVAYVRKGLQDAGHDVVSTPSPIIGLYPSSAKESAVWKKGLLDRGVYPSVIRYGDKSLVFRFAISSEHRFKQLQDLVGGLS